LDASIELEILLNQLSKASDLDVVGRPNRFFKEPHGSILFRARRP
jgi:hypothetical protein